jgi:hypothetical protein
MSIRKLTPLLLLVAGASYADTVQIVITNLPAVFENGEYVGYAPSTINGLPAFLICDDQVSHSYVPSGTMIFDYSSLAGSDPLQYARFDQPAFPATTPPAQQTQSYEEAAVILWQLSRQVAPSNDTVTAYQYAIWNLMNPTVALDPSLTAQEQAIQTFASTEVNTPAQAAFLAANVYPHLGIYTPTAAYSTNQEFLTYTATPEPGMFPIAAGALLLLMAIARRTRAQALLVCPSSVRGR